MGERKEERKETRQMANGQSQQVRTVQRDKAVSLLAVGMRVDDICSQLRVNRKTVYKWLKEPEFMKKLDEERELINIAGTSVLGGVVEQAAVNMAEAIRDGDTDMTKFFLRS